MDNRKLKDIFNLKSEEGEYGLIIWYNRLIEKTYSELDEFDVGKMLRQNVLFEIGKGKVIDLFLQDPFCGEFYNGDMIKKIIEYCLDGISVDQKTALLDIIKNIEKMNLFDNAINSEDIDEYLKNLSFLKQYLLGNRE